MVVCLHLFASKMSRCKGLCLEVFTRIVLLALFMYLENATPFIRKIQTDELWLYRNPFTPSYVPNTILWPLVIIIPTFFLILQFLIKKDKTDFYHGLLALTLALSLNGAVTNLVKVIVGRPRPDFFYRCFPSGTVDLNLMTDISSSCTGHVDIINDGRKSFPSGHSSFAFCSLGFLSFWLMGKFGIFNRNRGEGWRVIVCLAPMAAAMMVALSRTCDYHHHWQDVLVGSMLGMGISFMCYRQYYPSLSSFNSHKPYTAIPTSNSKRFRNEKPNPGTPIFSDSETETATLQEVKWI